MIRQSIAAGLAGIRRRPGLIALLYGMNLLLAFVLSVPVYFALQEAIGPTGFGEDLARSFDVVLWADILEKAGDVLQAIPFQLLWMVPLYLLWKVAASVGLIHALRGEQIRPFWEGVGRYTGRAFLIALLYIVLFAAGIVGIIVLTLILNSVWPGEVGTFWVNFVIVPTAFISMVAVLDLMHDFANIALVVEEKPVLQATLRGLRWPLKYGRASWLYLAWFVPAALLLLLPTVLDMTLTAGTGLAIFGLFLLQQLLLLLRAAMTVGWLGSEVAFFEAIWIQEAPLIAEEAVEMPSAPGQPWLDAEQDGFAPA
ncbi:MAG TPA: hypothetical protein VKP65_00610 [Rhodothermales bacterium]|nr:hypothetical protein [Rhodothermales bacterium]